MKKAVSLLKVGDVIMPPPRELQLWMRRRCKEKGLSETALYLTITEIREGSPDKNGRWLLITSSQTAEWYADFASGPAPFMFKARPATLWDMA